MIRTRLGVLIAVLACIAPVRADSFIQAADGKWERVRSGVVDGRLVVNIEPPGTPGGRTRLVLDKPEWMTLDDNEPPLVTAAQLDDQGLDVGEVIDLGVSDGHPAELSVGVVDAANPIDLARASLSLGEARLSAAPAASADPVRNAVLRFALPELGPGKHEGLLTVPDRAPLGNTLRMPVRVSVFGVHIAPDNQGVVLSSLDSEFRVGPGPRLPITIGAGGPEAYVTGQIAGTWLYPREITSVEMLVDEPNRKVCRLTTKFGEHDGTLVEKPGRYEYDLELRRDLPCLLVRSRLVNEIADGEVYCFWGWLPGEGYVTANGAADWTMTYSDLGTVGWVYLPPTDKTKRGIGWISPLVFGQSRFGTMLLYTSPQKVRTIVGETVEMPFALMLADGPEQVAEVAEKLSELGVWE
ncbi:MAG: hypothetical protein HPY44_14510 [Armatimonadetes bacterium]|nr:hypothetical protein [Armatimonadota bacterium]